MVFGVCLGSSFRGSFSISQPLSTPFGPPSQAQTNSQSPEGHYVTGGSDGLVVLVFLEVSLV